MKKIILVFSLAISAFHFASAQSAQSIYLELGGPGIASFNYDLRFSGRQGGLGGRIGVGSSFAGNGDSAFYLPVGINYLLGKEKRHYFEIGGGVTPVFGTGPEDDSAIAQLFGHLVLCYRFQPIGEGFTFRAFMCPIYGNGIFVPYYAGLSGGIKF